MKILLTQAKLFIELDEQDAISLSNKYALSSEFSFSILDDESLKVTLKMDSSNELCMMFEENELIIFLPFNDFEKWLLGEDLQYVSSEQLAASSRMEIIIRKELSVSTPNRVIKTNQKNSNGPLPGISFNYN